MSLTHVRYHIPEHTQAHIDYITPGIAMLELRQEGATRLKRRTASGHLTRMKKPLPANVNLKAASSDTLAFCNSIITPNCIFAMYNITEGTTSRPGNELGIFEQAVGYLSHADMNLYYENVYPRIPNGTYPTIDLIDGAQNLNKVGPDTSEANLDFQVPYPIIWPQNSILYLTDDLYGFNHKNGTGLFNTFLDAIVSTDCI